MALRLQQELALANESLTRFKTLHQLNINKQRSGIISRSELLTSAVEVENKIRYRDDIKRKLQLEKLAIAQILELESPPTVSKAKMQVAQTILPLTQGQIIELIEQGTSYRLGDKSILQLDKLYRLEQEKAKPQLDFALSIKGYGRADNWGDSLSNNNGDKYELFAGVTFDFDIGKKRSSNEIAKILSQKQLAIFKRQQIKKQLTNLFAQTQLDVRSNLQQINFLQTIAKKQRQILTIDKRRFKNGKITTLDYVKSQENYDHTILQMIQLDYANEMRSLSLLKMAGQMPLYLKSYLH
jgi:outer membrane protein TolC